MTEMLGTDPERLKKHIEIDDALNQLEKEVLELRDLAVNLTDGPSIKNVDDEEKRSVRNFLSVYDNIANRIFRSAKEIYETREQIRGMLL
ncbi:MAG: hypothetical protein BBJ57_02345 [Desulfobacterales bacterium PC51MH44]|nr:MAG: hypothetical protein BBJ57_02345 [Desulfobacterales bacterium PC51MH44]